MNTLQDLTGQESGIVVYRMRDSMPEGVICNWSSVGGLPRLFMTGGLLGLNDIDDDGINGIPLDEIQARSVDDIGAALDGTEIIYDANGDADSLHGLSGTVWKFEDPFVPKQAVEVYAPDGWV